MALAGIGQASGKPLHDADELTSLSAAKEAPLARPMRWPASPPTTSTSPKFTIASPSPKSSPARTSASSPPARAARAVDEGRTALDGDRPINTSGGLKSKGHPVGASGVGQVVEIYHQLRGEAGERQAKKPRLDVGLTHNVGGTGGTCVVNVLRLE